MNKKILKTASLYMIFSIINQAFGLFIQLALMRGVSISNYGEYAINFEAMALMQLVLANAYRNFYLQKIRQNNLNEDVSSLINFQTFNGSLSILIFGIVVSCLYKLKVEVAIFLVLSNVLSSLILPLQAKWLANNERAKLIIKDTATSILSLVAVYISVNFLHLSINEITIVQFMLYGVVSIIFCFILDKTFISISNFNETFSIGFVFEKKLYVFMLIFIVNALHNKYGGLFLRNFSSEIQTALYLAAFKFINPLFFVQTSMISAFMPSFIKDKSFKFDNRVFLMFAMPGAILSLTLFSLFPLALSILNIEQYLPAYEIIKIACLFVFIVFVYGAMSNYISVSGGQSFILIINVIALLIMFVSTLLFQHVHNSSLMLIRVFVFAECFVCVSYYIYLIRLKIRTSVLFLFAPLMCILINTGTIFTK